jgi:arsenate reductase-like glutaredoxin family protein
MNIQIFGTKKSADTRKAERFFKERGIRFQFVDLSEKGLSKGEMTSVMQAVGGLNMLIDDKAKDQDTLVLIRFLAEEDRFAKLLENQQILKQPVVRNGKQATVGYCPEVWKKWE